MSVDDKYRKSTAAAIPNFRIPAPVRSQITPNRKVKLSPDEKSGQKTLLQQLREIMYGVVFRSTTFMRTL